MQAVTLYRYFKWHSKHINTSQYKSTHVSTSSEASGMTDAKTTAAGNLNVWADIQFTKTSVASCTELGRILSDHRHINEGQY